MSVQQIEIEASNGKSILLDYRLPENSAHAPLLIFLHGFKGFKDWGHFNLIADWLCRHGVGVLKFNFSMNGTTSDQPTDFANLEAFGNNTFSQEVNDTKTVIDWVEENLNGQYHPGEIYLAGHSRGGGIALLVASQDQRITKLVTWSAVSDFEKRFTQEQFKAWDSEGVIYIPNSRTDQNMPLYKIVWEDYLKHFDALNIEKAAKRLRIPYLIVHGEMDATVHHKEALQLQKWTGANLDFLPSADHVYGGYHPYDKEELPKATHQLLSVSRAFLLS